MSAEFKVVSTQLQLKDINTTVDAIQIYPQTEAVTLRQCRICLSSDLQDELISPCQCTGSVKYVHRGCLKQWLQVKAIRDAQNPPEQSQGISCQLCKYVIKVQVELKRNCNSKQKIKQQISSKLLLFVFSLIAIICSLALLGYSIAYLSSQIGKGYNNASTYERVVVILSIVINMALIIYHVHNLKGYFYHKKAEINFPQKVNNSQ